MAGSLYSVGPMENIIAEDIIHNIKMADRRFTMLMMHRQWGMLGRIFHGFMQCWIIGRCSTSHLLLRWNVSFVINLFLF